MSGAMEIAGIGLSSQQRALDTIANNIANLNTQSFKRSEIRFTEMMAQTASSSVLQANLGSETVGVGVSAQQLLQLESQGELQTTNRPLDIAISGAGFVELLGPAGQIYLWRGGSLQVNENGLLTADNGMPLRSMVTVPLASSELLIDTNGQVLSRSAGEVDAIEIGRINLVRPSDFTGIERLDGGLYRVDHSVNVTEAMPGEDGMGMIVQGALERSNVDLNDEMVQLMIVQRAYAANAKIVQAADELASIANGLRR